MNSFSFVKLLDVPSSCHNINSFPKKSHLQTYSSKKIYARKLNLLINCYTDMEFKLLLGFRQTKNHQY